MPLPLVRASATACVRNADGKGGCVVAIMGAVPGIVIPSLRVSSEPAHAYTPRGASLTLYGQNKRDDDQRRCDGERGPR